MFIYGGLFPREWQVSLEARSLPGKIIRPFSNSHNIALGDTNGALHQPTLNPYSWTNLTNMLWVEQPVGTGFSIGQVTATSQEEIAQDFIKFFKNFQVAFGIKNFKIYVTGESYAGRYVPYISAAMLDAKDKTYYDVQGISGPSEQTP